VSEKCFNTHLLNVNKRNKGEGVSIGIVCNGQPTHVNIDIQESENFCDQSHTLEDTHGLSTEICGIINSQDENNLTGISPKSNLYIAKSLNNKLECNTQTLDAGILWCVIKKCHIVVLCFDHNNIDLSKSIEKAKQLNTVILGYSSKTNDVPDVHLTNRWKVKKDVKTTAINNDFKSLNRPIHHLGITAGIASLIVQEFKKRRKGYKPQDVYQEIYNLQNQKVTL